MSSITYARLSNENFTPNSMDEFLRYQKITQVYRKTGEEYVLVDTDNVLDWNLDQRRGVARIILQKMHDGGFAFGAFEGGRVVGYILADGKRFGSEQQYIEITLFHVSAHHRRMGIGTRLFLLACEEAKKRGAHKLYISSGNAKETQDAYRKLGCLHAQEINAEAVARNPDDVQLEYPL